MAPRAKSLYQQERVFIDAAIDSVSDHHDHDDAAAAAEAQSSQDKMVAVARDFLSTTCPRFLSVVDGHSDQGSTIDRLVKVGRNVTATLAYASARGDLGVDPARRAKTDATLQRLVSECGTLADVLDGKEERRVPTVRFGRTELNMPLITFGCMRFQQSWNRTKGRGAIDNMDKVNKDCQDNLVSLIRYAVSMGANHIETALSYGSSELQMGAALKVLFESGEIKREDLIVQTKGGISSSTTPAQYRQTILEQIERLGVDYLDLFGVHGCNTFNHYDWLYNHGETGNLIDVLHELKAEGKIRFYGFSTHAPAEVTRKLIQDGDFDYVNLHHHFCGDYTASGDGDCGGNIDNVRLANARDMGVFVISPYDKGGRLYTPSNRLRDLTLPEFEPIEYGSLWLWHHRRLHREQAAAVHTITLGAARPSDLDQPLYAALRSLDGDVADDVDAVAARMREAADDELGEDWARNWHVGVPNCNGSAYGTQIGNIVWLHNAIRAYGMRDYAKDRYANMENNLAAWDKSKTREENVKANTWMPGCAYDPTKDYSVDLKNCPADNVEKVKDAMAFVHKWCSKKEGGADSAKDYKLDAPLDWQIAYDMRPWTAFPERP